MRRLARPFVKTKQTYIFSYMSKCSCGAPGYITVPWIEALLEAAKGAEAQLRAALELDDYSPLLEMFMGREPFAKEIKGMPE